MRDPSAVDDTKPQPPTPARPATEPDDTEAPHAEAPHAEPAHTEALHTEPDNAEPDNAEPDNAEPDNADTTHAAPDDTARAPAAPDDPELARADQKAAEPGSAAAESRDLAVTRARAEVRQFLAGRPEVRDKVVRSLLPPWLSTLHLGSLKVAGGLMLLGAGGSMVANQGAPWFFHLVDVLLLVLGLGTLWSVIGQVSMRRIEATRLRVHGPDEGDTIAVAGVRLVTRPWWRNAVGWLFDLVVLGSPVLVALRAWSDGGWPARIAAVCAAGCVVAGSVYIVHSARTAPQWRRDFIEFEGMKLPPVRDEWDVLLR
ncbi:hypothetical protein ACQPZF_34315 [Actinosynnema sp. CS-041913]|uniref:hypothetical protein n=1 Tax=Actinosynnema sp. CS-041913 TaxID=3239917 RepID=UPI003D8E7E0D